MNDINSISFRNSCLRWLGEDSQSQLTKFLLGLVMPAKELLHGVQFPRDANDRVIKCIEESRHVERLRGMGNNPKDVVEIGEEARIHWLAQTCMDCATEQLAGLPVNPFSSPIPLSEHTAWRLRTSPIAAGIVVKHNCLPCHLRVEKKISCLKAMVNTETVFTVSPEARYLLPEYLNKQIDGTPFYFSCRRGDCEPILLNEFERFVNEHCSGGQRSS